MVNLTCGGFLRHAEPLWLRAAIEDVRRVKREARLGFYGVLRDFNEAPNRGNPFAQMMRLVSMSKYINVIGSPASFDVCVASGGVKCNG